MAPASTTVLHSHPTWLRLTHTWLYHLIRYLPPDIVSHIVCGRTARLDLYQVPNIHSLNAEPLAVRWRNRLCKGLGWDRLRNHLPLVVARTTAQLVHSHFGGAAWADHLALGQRRSCKHLVTFYGHDMSGLPRKRVWRERYQSLFAACDGVIALGSYMAKGLAELGCPEQKLQVHHLGVEVETYAYKPRSWNGNGPLKVLIAGRFCEKKGIPDALAALGKVHPRVPLAITVIGDAEDNAREQAEKRRILDTVAQYQLKDVTTFLGYQPYTELFRLSYEHHLFLAPSVLASDGDHEGGYPIVMTEMMATGMPIVSTVHADIPEVIRHGHNGLLAPEHDVDALAEHIQWLADHPHAWADLIAAGRHTVERDYHAAVQGQRLGAIYRRLAS